MLARGKVEEALERKRELFLAAVDRSERVLSEYRSGLERVTALPPSDVVSGVGGVEWPGALPAAEWDRGFVIPFQHRWDTRQDAAAWALDTIAGVTTVAVDGSQAGPSKEFGVPVSLVQVAWFENPHDPERPYVKDARNEIVTPGDTPDEMEEYAFAESRLNQCRFVMEMGAAVERIGRLDPSNCPLVFLDGSLILSFTGRMAPAARDAYLDALFRVLEASERCRVPVIGYVDASLASDLSTLVRTVEDLGSSAPPDPFVLDGTLDTFERTAACLCARGDVLPHYRRADRDRSRDIYFTYLEIGPTRPPARIEFPRWILDGGLLDRVMDIVRAEIVIGEGYPYALETADAAAVLTQEDRLAFYEQYHRFAADHGFDRSVPGKSISKARRR